MFGINACFCSLRNIRAYHWRKIAAELKLDPDDMLQHVSDPASQAADHASVVKQQMIKEGLTHPINPRLAGAVAKRAAASRKIIQG